MKRVALLILILLFTQSLVIGSQKPIEQGKFVFFIKNELAGEESFSLQEIEKGNLSLSSNFVAKSQELIIRFETDKLFKQEIVTNKDWKLIAYTLDSETAQGKFNVTVKVEGQIATINWQLKRSDGKEQNAVKEVILEGDEGVVTTGLAASQLLVLQKIIATRMKENKKTFLALDPTNIEKPLVELTVEKLSPVKIKSGSDVLEAQRASIKISGEDFKLELLYKDTTLWGITAESGTSKTLVYRQDLFPKGFEVPGQ